MTCQLNGHNFHLHPHLWKYFTFCWYIHSSGINMHTSSAHVICLMENWCSETSKHGSFRSVLTYWCNSVNYLNNYLWCLHAACLQYLESSLGAATLSWLVANTSSLLFTIVHSETYVHKITISSWQTCFHNASQLFVWELSVLKQYKVLTCAIICQICLLWFVVLIHYHTHVFRVKQ